MVLAQYTAATGEGVVVEVSGLLVLAQLVQVCGEIVGRVQGVGMVLPSTERRRSVPVRTTAGRRRVPLGSAHNGRRGRAARRRRPRSDRVWRASVAARTCGSSCRQRGQVGRVVPGVGWNCGTEQPDRDGGHVVLVGLGAQDGLQQPVQLQAVGLDAGQPCSAQQPSQLGEGQRITGRGGRVSRGAGRGGW